MSGAPVLSLDLRERRRATLFWVLGILALVAITIGSYPAVRANPELGAFTEDLPEFLRTLLGENLATPAGFLGSQLYLSMLPVLFLVLTIGRAAATLAGEEQDGTLELTLAHPITRTRLLLEKFAGVTIVVLIVFAATWLATWIGAVAIDMGISAPAVGSATFSTMLLALAIGSVTYAVGAATGRKGLAMGVGAGLASVSWILYGIAPLVDVPGLDQLTLWEHAVGGDPLVNGFDGHGSLVLLAITAIALTVAVVTFQRRDLGTT